MMKKITFLLAAFVFAFAFANAQQANRSDNVQKDAKFDKTFKVNKGTMADTLYPASFYNDETSLALWSSNNGGYVFGPNGYGDVAKVQVFENSDKLHVSGFGVYVAVKELEGDADDVAFNLYAVGDDGPGDVLATKNVSTADFDTTGNYTFVEFDSPVEVNENFAVGLDFTAVDDTFGIVSTADGDAGEADLAWQKNEDETWSSVLSLWGLDVDMAFSVTYTVTTYSTTFSLDMTDVETDVFDPATDQLYVTGSMVGWAEPGTEGSLALTLDETSGTYTATIELANGDYEYKYFVGSGWDNGEWDGGANRTFTVDGAEQTLNDVWGDEPVNVEEVAFEADINVYPNPSTGLFNITTTESMKLEVFDISGRTVKSQIIDGNTQVQLRNAGMYFFRFSNENGSTVNKVIVK